MGSELLGSCQPWNNEAMGACSGVRKEQFGSKYENVRVPELSLSAQEHLPEEEEAAGDPCQAAVTQDSDAHLAQHPAVNIPHTSTQLNVHTHSHTPTYAHKHRHTHIRSGTHT